MPIKNPIHESAKGAILIGRKNRNKSGGQPHPIIYLGPDTGGTDVFIGAMLTHAEGYGNTGLSAEHFETHDASGKRFPIQFDDSYVVTKKFLKLLRWAPFVKRGQLSKTGMAFVENLVKDMVAEEYYDNA